MPDPMEGIGRPLEDPMAGIGKPLDRIPAPDPMAGIGKPVLDYDPRIGERIPVNGSLDKFANLVGQPTEKMVGATMEVVGAPQRFVASELMGKGIKKSLQNAAPSWIGGTPEDSPTGDQMADAIGIPRPAEVPGFDREGNVNWSNMGNKALWAARELGPTTLTDPLTFTHFGASKAGKAAEASARESILAGTAKFADNIEAASHTMPTLAQQIERGHTGATIKIPFGPELGFIPAPKILAPVAKVFEPLLSTLKKGKELFTGPDARDPMQLKIYREQGIANQKVYSFLREKIKPNEEFAAKHGFEDQAMKYWSDLSEAADGDGNFRVPEHVTDQFEKEHIPLRGENATYTDAQGNVHRGRVHVDAMEKAGVDWKSLKPGDDTGNGFMTSKGRVVGREEAAQLQSEWKRSRGEAPGTNTVLGSEDLNPTGKLPLQDGWPKEFAKDAEYLNRNRSDVASAADAAFKEGPRHMAPQINAALEYASTLTPEKRAAGFEMSQRIAKTAKEVRDFAIANKVDVPELNGDVKAMPRKLFDAIYAIDNRMASTPMVPGAKSKIKGPLKELIEKAKGKGPLTAIEMDTLLNELKGELPKRDPWKPGFVKDSMGNMVLETEPPAPVKDINFEARDLIEKRDMKDGPRQTTPSQLTHEEMNDLRNALFERVPNAMKQYNGVPNYRPGMISELTQHEIDYGANTKTNPNLKRGGTGRDPEKAQRSGRVRDIGIKDSAVAPPYADMGDVKKTVYQQNETLGKGTEATAGNTLTAPWWHKFMTKSGLEEIARSGGKSFMEENALKAFRNQLEHPIRKAMTNAALDEAVLKTFDVVPEDLTKKAQDLFWRGVESGKKVPDPRDLKYWHEKGSLKAEPSGRANAPGFGPEKPVPWTKAEKKASAQTPSMPHDPFAPRPQPYRPEVPLVVEGNPAYGDPSSYFERMVAREEELAQAQTHANYDLPPNGRGMSDFAAGPNAVDRPQIPPAREYPYKHSLQGPAQRPPIDPLLTRAHEFQPRAEPNMGTTGGGGEFQRAYSEQPGRRPVTLAEMEDFWKEAGREDKFIDHLNPDAQKKIKAGAPLHEVVERNWTPASRELVELGDTSGYIHKGVANSLKEYKQLGNDPIGITRWMRKNAPAYASFLALSKKLATVWNMPAYIEGNMLGDFMRGGIGNAWDGKSASELRALNAHLDYTTSGGMNVDKFPEYDFGPKIGKKAGKEAAEILERTHAIGASGQAAQEFQFGETHAAKAAQNVAEAVPAAGRRLEDFMRASDNNLRSAAVAKFMREGASEAEAAFRVEEIFFDYNRKGPITQFLSQTGIVPFAAWNSKIIPYMAHWAVTRPGEFAFVQRLMQQVGSGQIPVSQLPRYMRSGTNIPVNIERDKDGHVSFGIVTDNGNIIPGNELVQLMNDPLGTGLSKIGLPLRLLQNAHDQVEQEGKDPALRTSWDYLKKYGEVLGGRPVSTYKTLTDPKKTGGEKLAEMFSPVKYRRFDWTKQSSFSFKDAEKAQKSAAYARAAAEGEVEKAKKEFLAANQKIQQTKALQYLPEDENYQKAQAVLKKQEERFEEAEKAFQQTIRDQTRVDAFVKRFNLVK